MSDVHDASYYGKCMIGGIFACGLTHAFVCPLDIVKCRKQVSLAPSWPPPLHQKLTSFYDVIRLTQACTAASPMGSERFTPLKA